MLAAHPVLKDVATQLGRIHSLLEGRTLELDTCFTIAIDTALGMMATVDVNEDDEENIISREDTADLAPHLV